MLLFMDGMAHYTSAEIAQKYTTRNDTACLWSIVPEGRYGNCLKRVSTSNHNQPGYLGIAPFTTRTGLWTPQSGGVCGFALKVDRLNQVSQINPDGPHSLLVLEEAGMTSGIGAQPWHIRLDFNNTGIFTLWRRIQSIAGDVPLASSLEGLTDNAWMYVECKWLIDSTVGTFEVRVNTIPILTFSGNTRVTEGFNDGVWNSVRLFGTPSNPPNPNGLTMRMCDFYLADLTGGAGDVRDFLGDGVIQTIFPNGPGLAAGWTPATAAPNWDQVNDKPANDGDATYVSALTPGLRDCHHFEDIPGGATVLGVHYNMLTRKESEGTVTVKPVTGQGGVQYDGPTQGLASLAYDRYLTQPYDVNPATGAAWTAAEINAGQWGIVKVS